MQVPSFNTIEISVAGNRGTLELDHPASLNPLGPEALAELTRAADFLAACSELKVVVVSGRGRAFSAGADVTAFAGGGGDSPTDPRAMADLGRLMADAVERIPAVTVARIQGHCVGGGLVLAAACDLRVAAEDARFSIPEVDLGIPLAWGGIPRLVREVGPAVTRDLVLSCRPFGPDEAKALGLVNRVVPDDELESAVAELASQLAAKSSYALRSTLQAVDAAAEAMVPTGGAWNDADSLMTALHDAESRAVARRYLEARGR